MTNCFGLKSLKGKGSLLGMYVVVVAMLTWKTASSDVAECRFGG